MEIYLRTINVKWKDSLFFKAGLLVRVGRIRYLLVYKISTPPALDNLPFTCEHQMYSRTAKLHNNTTVTRGGGVTKRSSY